MQIPHLAINDDIAAAPFATMRWVLISSLRTHEASPSHIYMYICRDLLYNA